MVPTLEDIKGSGGSIRVGTTGRIGALMTRELEIIKPEPVSSNAATPKRVQTSKCFDAATSSNSSSSSSSSSSRKPETPGKTKTHPGSTQRIPMLDSESVTLDRTPSRSNKRATNIVELVDVHCGDSDRAWARPVTTRL